MREQPLLGSNISPYGSEKALHNKELIPLCNAQKLLDFDSQTRIIDFVALHNTLFSVVEAARFND
ncbi:hypothetical protein ABT364_26755 [Massilia sp. SR12]